MRECCLPVTTFRVRQHSDHPPITRRSILLRNATHAGMEDLRSYCTMQPITTTTVPATPIDFRSWLNQQDTCARRTAPATRRRAEGID